MPSARVGGRFDLIQLSKEVEDSILSIVDPREVDLVLRSIEALCEDMLRFCLNPPSLVSGDANTLALAGWAIADDDELVVVTAKRRFYVQKKFRPFRIVIERMEDSVPDL